MILLDLYLPRKDGREVLKRDEDYESEAIPVVVLTTSRAEADIIRTYDSYANCYVTEPVNLDEFMEVVQSIESFWFSIVKLPPDGTR